MRIAKVLLCSTVAVQLVFTSCKKSNDLATDASVNAGVNYQLKASNATSVLTQRVAGTTVQWTAGFGNATLVKFEGTKDNKQIELKSKTAQRINLFAAAATFGNITIPSGTYSHVEFKVQLNKTATEPALELKGQFATANGTVPVIFRVNDLIEVKAEKENLIVTGSNAYNALTSVDLSKLTAGITQAMFTNAKITTEGLVISSSSNANLYNIIAENLRKSHESEFENEHESEHETEHHH